MLILTRRLGESIVIGDGIKVMVTEIRGKQVRLGIEAPPDVSVHRGEIYKKIQEENIRAIKALPENLKRVAELWKSYSN